MLDLGWTELLVVALITVLIFGPKELPTVLRTVTQFVSKLRGMARDFQRTMDDVAREAELDKLKKDVTDATSGNSMLDPTGTENNMFDKLFDDDEEVDGTPSKEAAKKQSSSPVPGFDRAPDDGADDQPAVEATQQSAATEPKPASEPDPVPETASTADTTKATGT